MQRAVSTAFWIFLIVTCLVMFVGALVLWLVVGPFDPKRRVQHLYSCFWAQIFFYANPMWRLHIEGRNKLPWHGKAVLVANHQSLGDILVLFGLYRPFKWVSKESVFRVPLIGWNMSFNRYVPLKRGDRQSVIAMLDACRAWLARGVPVLLFPEGTRSPDGAVKAFKPGAFQIAVESGAPVYPIVVTGTADTLPKHGYLLRKKADCRVRVLDPVDPARFGGDVGALSDHVRGLIVDEKDRMEGIARAA